MRTLKHESDHDTSQVAGVNRRDRYGCNPRPESTVALVVRHHASVMKYPDGSLVKLGDIITIPLPSGSAKARVVMLGDTREHLDIEKSFLDWVESDQKLLEPSYVVVEWVDRNPLAHNNPKYAPVGNYMLTEVDECVTHND
jgi:hypothetical protein